VINSDPERHVLDAPEELEVLCEFQTFTGLVQAIEFSGFHALSRSLARSAGGLGNDIQWVGTLSRIQVTPIYGRMSSQYGRGFRAC
jgi:hypothetical protein